MDTGYSIDHIAGIRERVKKELKPARYEHTLGVAYTAACMAFLYGEDPLKAELAGILHDCAKCYPHEEQIRICREAGIGLSEAELASPAVIHAICGRYLAEKVYGITDEDFESKLVNLGALIVREVNDNPSNFRFTRTLSELLEDSDVPGIYGVDTRKLVRSIRDKGSRKALITSYDTSLEEGLKVLKETELRRDAVKRCSSKKRWYARTTNPKFSVVAIDCGMKMNIVRELNQHGCNVTVVPYNTTPEEIIGMKPDGLFISNGPGDPEDVPEVIETHKTLRGQLPMFGICLGHQLIALSYRAIRNQLKFGHMGRNHEVKDLST